MLNLDDIVCSSEHNDWPFRMLIIGHQVLVKQTLYYI